MSGVALSLDALLAALPPQIWYLTSNGDAMWCRRPYGFLFSNGPAAEAFAARMGTGQTLFAIGSDTRDFISPEMLAGLQQTEVTRLFIDPEIDADSGDVHGTILRLGDLQ